MGRNTHRRWRSRGSIVLTLAVLAALTLVVPSPVAAAPGDPVPGTDVLYTTDEDFDKGLLVNVNHDAPNGNQLQLNESAGTFPFIWVALSGRGTIVKIDTETGDILGEYATTSDGDANHNPSRTTVALDGSAWAGNRNQSSVIHVGLAETNSCVDRNQDGDIDTSTGYDDVLPWPGGSNSASSSVDNAQDECILHYLDTPGGDARHMSVDADNNLWIGSYSSSKGLVKVDGDTATFLLGGSSTFHRSIACGGYGGLIDGNGVIWSANGDNSGLFRWDPNAPDSGDGTSVGSNPRCIPVRNYGLAVDPNGDIWATTLTGNQVRKVSADGSTVTGPFTHGSDGAQGLAVDSNGHVWVSSSLFCSSNCTIGHLTNDGAFVGNVSTPTGSGSTGIAVDSNGKVWAADIHSNNAIRIDPTAGALGADSVTPIGAVDLTVPFPTTANGTAGPYNYSDMTGTVALGSTAPQGTWTVVQDAGTADFAWTTVILNTEDEGFVPPGATLAVAVEARAADSVVGLGSETFEPVENCGVAGIVGRFIQVRVTLLPNTLGESPVLSDVRIRGGAIPTANDCLGLPDEEPLTEEPPTFGPPNYSMASNLGDVFAFSSSGGRKIAHDFTSEAPVVGLAVDPDGTGQWVVASDGSVFRARVADVGHYGSMAGIPLGAPIVAIVPTATGLGYWLIGADGGVFAFGDAVYYGSMGGISLNAPIVGAVRTASGNGYILVARDGGVFAFGDAVFAGSMGGRPLNKPIVGIAVDRDGTGYYMVAEDGGVFAFLAVFHGSLAGIGVNAAVMGIATDPDEAGYWLGARDGGAFAFNADFLGSAQGLLGGSYIGATAVGIASR